MKRKKYKFEIGDKVVPVRKSIGKSLKFCKYWNKAKIHKQPFLFVVGYADDKTLILNSEENRFKTGDYFSVSDVIPYKKEGKKEKWKILYKGSSSRLYEWKEWHSFKELNITVREYKPKDLVFYDGYRYKVICQGVGIKNLEGFIHQTTGDVKYQKREKFHQYQLHDIVETLDLIVQIKDYYEQKVM